jgi:hypothetical protein
MGTGMPKAALPAKPAHYLAAGGIRFWFADFAIQDLSRKKIDGVSGSSGSGRDMDK